MAWRELWESHNGHSRIKSQGHPCMPWLWLLALAASLGGPGGSWWGGGWAGEQLGGGGTRRVEGVKVDSLHLSPRRLNQIPKPGVLNNRRVFLTPARVRSGCEQGWALLLACRLPPPCCIPSWHLSTSQEGSLSFHPPSLPSFLSLLSSCLHYLQTQQIIYIKYMCS